MIATSAFYRFRPRSGHTGGLRERAGVSKSRRPALSERRVTGIAGKSRVATLPIKFNRTVAIEFRPVWPSTSRRLATFEKGQIVDNLIVCDFDDFSAILEYPDGWVVFAVPKSYFVAAPNF